MGKILSIAVFLPVILIIVVFLELFASGSLLAMSFCDRPIHFRVDTVDPRFNISKDAFLADIKQAVQIWAKAINKELFIYDPAGDLSINLIYDERQSLTSQINQLENKVQSEKQSLNPQISEYKDKSLEFKRRLDEFNAKVQYWNSQGGAPPEEYNKITLEQQSLKAEADNLNDLARNLNVSADTFNSQVNELNQIVTSLSSVLEERPEEGIFKGPENRIEIYFNISRQELVHTIAHELGHALGIQHVGNLAAIMFSKTSQKIILTDEDISALEEVCKKYTVFELLQIKLAEVIVANKFRFSL